MNIVIKENNNYIESLGAIDLTAPDTVLILHHYDELDWNIVSILIQFNKQYDLNNSTITLCYPEETMLEMVAEIPLIGICHLFMEEHDLKPSNLIFITGNFLAPDMYRRWREDNNKSDKSSIHLQVHTSHWDHWTSVQKRRDYHGSHKRTRPFKYVNLNGGPRDHRSEILNYLHGSNFLKLGLNSCHYTSSKLHVEIIKCLPLRPDHLSPNSHGANQSHLYDNSYFSIVTETSFNNDEGGITEKSFMAFYYRHPFIMVSSPGTLAELHRLGFQTFDGLIDESYDDIIDDEDRMHAVKLQIHKLCSMSNKDLKDWYNSLSDIYDHNQNLLYQWGATTRRNRPRGQSRHRP